MLGHDGERLLALGPERLRRVVRLQCVLGSSGGPDLAPLHPVGECREWSVYQLDLISEREDGRFVQRVTGPA